MRVIIMGGGKTVYFLARQFVSKGTDLTIINKQADEAASLSRQFRHALVIHGDGSDPQIQEAAGVRQGDVFLALTPHDQDNLIACQIAQRMFGIGRTVAMVNDPGNETIFRQLGVSAVFSASRILALLIEEQTDFEGIINLFPVAGGRITVTEVTLRTPAPALDRTLAELQLPTGSLIAGIIRHGEVDVPRGSSRLQDGDRLLLVSQPESYGDALRALLGDEV